MNSPTCRDPARELLPFYLNGSLEGAEAAAVPAHVESCAVCSRDLDELSQVAAAIEKYGAVAAREDEARSRPAPSRRRPLILAAAVLIPVIAGALWGYLALSGRGRAAREGALTPTSETRVVTMDLGSGPMRGQGALPVLHLSAVTDRVRFIFFVPVTPEGRYSAEIRDYDGSVLLPEQRLGALDSLGRARLEVSAERLGPRGERELVAYREDSGSRREAYRFPFTVHRGSPREAGHD